MAGLVGAGRTELARVALRRRPRCSAGEVRLDGQPMSIRTPRDAIERGIFLVPEDRKRSGLVLDMSIEREHLAAQPAGLSPPAC